MVFMCGMLLFSPSLAFTHGRALRKYIQYNALLEYGGWGVRVSPLGMAFIAGNTGVQLVLKDGSKVLIGTNQVEEMKGLKKDGLVTGFHGASQRA